jgi:hypothetical protein
VGDAAEEPDAGRNKQPCPGGAFMKRKRIKEALAILKIVWVAEAPTHLIHFNGSRFLGPYGFDKEGQE